MDLITPHYLTAMLESHDFSSLLQAASAGAAALLGEDLAGGISLFLFAHGWENGWVLNAMTLNKRRVFRPVRLSAELDAAKSLSGSGIHLAHFGPSRLLGGEALYPGEAARTALVPLADGELETGLLLAGVRGEAGRLHPECEAGLRYLGRTMARLIPRILLYEQTRLQNQQMQHLNEGILKSLLSPNKSALLASLLMILNRHFGLSRIMIAQVHLETQTLRGELHSGFGPDFVPLTVPLDSSGHPLVQIMNQGDVLILDRAAGGGQEALPEMFGGAAVERRVIMPLMIGMKPVGLIYADQQIHDGTLYFREVFEMLARLAAAALENLNQRLRAEQRAETDALTGLYNRYFLDKILEIEIPRVKRYNHSISLLMLDLCDFKHFNDTYGHQFGDYILRETASLLQANVRRPDIVVRFGGDEFVVLMVNTTNEQAQLVKSRIEHAFIERNRMQTDERYVIKISIGLRSADARTIENLMHEADMEMYAHKAHQTRLQLIESLLQANPEKIEAADRIVGSLCNILYKKAPYYPEHARRVAHLALILARRLALEEREVETLALAALLHDVGKVSIPTEILQKIEPLTASEIAAMRHHPALGEEFFQGLEHLEPLRPIIRSHHERYDGQMGGAFPGYPDGLCGERIPLAARILKLAESAECMLYGVPYQAGRPPEEVARLVREESGKSFDPRLVSVLLADKAWYQELGDPERIREMLNLEG